MFNPLEDSVSNVFKKWLDGAPEKVKKYFNYTICCLTAATILFFLRLFVSNALQTEKDKGLPMSDIANFLSQIAPVAFLLVIGFAILSVLNWGEFCAKEQKEKMALEKDQSEWDWSFVSYMVQGELWKMAGTKPGELLPGVGVTAEAMAHEIAKCSATGCKYVNAWLRLMHGNNKLDWMLKENLIKQSPIPEAS